MKFLAFLLFLGALSYGYLAYVFPWTTIQAQSFNVSRGDTIAGLPEKVGIKVHPMLYKAYIRLYASDIKLQAGTYKIEAPVTLKEFLLTTIKAPTSKDLTITLLPGWNIWDMDAYLTREEVLKAGEFTRAAENIPPELKKLYPFLGKATTLEWFLMPDTYRINPIASADSIVRMLLAEFNKRIYTEYEFTSDTELYKTLIFASIVEKEEKSSVNRPIVAGILKKRFDEGIAIGADATVCYGYRLAMTECTPAFIGEHIYEKNDYNTRSVVRLTPTPIANPSAETIRATIQSEPSKYYYYLHDDDGVIHYGKTLEDHNRNRVQYLGK